jgi:hypothetical protein
VNRHTLFRVQVDRLRVLNSPIHADDVIDLFACYVFEAKGHDAFHLCGKCL